MRQPNTCYVKSKKKKGSDQVGMISSSTSYEADRHCYKVLAAETLDPTAHGFAVSQGPGTQPHPDKGDNHLPLAEICLLAYLTKSNSSSRKAIKPLGFSTFARSPREGGKRELRSENTGNPVRGDFSPSHHTASHKNCNPISLAHCTAH